MVVAPMLSVSSRGEREYGNRERLLSRGIGTDPEAWSAVCVVQSAVPHTA